MRYKKSPLSYMGNKYRLLPQIMPMFPKNIKNFYDVFGGSGVVSLNVKANKVYYNDFNEFVSSIIYNCFNYNSEMRRTLDKIHLKEKLTSSDSKEEQIKFNKIRVFVNEKIDRTSLEYVCYILYLHTFSINSLIRFNKIGEFNAPYGFISGMKYSFLDNRLNFCKRKIDVSNKDFNDFLDVTLNEEDFIYCDPPYLNTMAVYNENRLTGWDINDDYRLFNKLDDINKKGIKFAMSNVLTGKDGTKNNHLREWIKVNGYEINYIDHKYATFGKANNNSIEVLITNYEVPEKQLDMFEIIGGNDAKDN